MTILVELDPETEARVTAEADSLGVRVQEYVTSLIQKGLPSSAQSSVARGKLTPDALRKMSEKMTKWSDRIPVLPPEATDRDSFYEDR